MNIIEQARNILKKYNQDHIKVENEKIAQQIIQIDFEKLHELQAHLLDNNKIDNVENIEPVKAIKPSKMSLEEIEEIKKLGREEVKLGKYAICIMAGGQGTRLGHNGPKGTFEIELNSQIKSLFEVIVDKLKYAKRDYGIYLKCYIMTSPENHENTVKFFEKMNFFGYPKEYIKFFMQEEIPVLDENGKIIIGENGLIKLASEGNGGIFYSMSKHGIINEMKENNIEWVFIGSVDNLLVNYVDTLLLGLAMKKNVKIATKTVLKNSPYERVGVLCKKNGRVNVVEYTEISEDMRLAVDENEEILYGESHIMCNLFNIEAIEKASTKELKYHVAKKKMNYIDSNGNLIIAKTENCYKFEKFVFDSFGLFNEIAILRGKRENDFAPIKNAEGQDSPETAKKLYEQFCLNKNIKG